MKTCKNCNIEVPDDEIFCPKCGEMIDRRFDPEDVMIQGAYSPPQALGPMSISDVVLTRRYGKNIINALRAVAKAIAFVTAGSIIAIGVLTILGKDPLGLPPQRQMLVGILALPIALIVGFLLYFLCNIAVTKYENLSLVGRNTEAQLQLLENQSQLIASLADTMNENSRRIDVIGEMLDDVLRVSERQVQAVENLPENLPVGESSAEKSLTDDSARDDNLSLINENLCNGAANTQIMLRRVENAVNNGLNKLYRMWYAALNKGEEPPEEDLPAPGHPAAKEKPAFKAEPKPAPNPEPKPEPRPEPRPEPKPEPRPEPRPEPAPVVTTDAPSPHAAAQTFAHKDRPTDRNPEPKQNDPLDQIDSKSSGELLLGDEEYDLDAIIVEAAADNSSVTYLSTDTDDK